MKIKIVIIRIPEIFLYNRIRISVAPQAYLEYSETSTKEYFWVYS